MRSFPSPLSFFVTLFVIYIYVFPLDIIANRVSYILAFHE
jgi:hypothetical protein